MSLGFVNPYFDGPFRGVTGGVRGATSGMVTVTPTGSGIRRNPSGSGLDQIQVRDPDNPNRVIWVDAIYDPVNDWMIPVDRRYRNPGDENALFRIFGNQFADSTEADPDGIVPSTEPPSSAGSSSSGVLIVVVLLGLYLATR